MFLFPIGSITKTSQNISCRQIRKIFQNLILRHSRSQIRQNIINRNSHSSNAGLPTALTRLKRNDVLIIHRKRANEECSNSIASSSLSPRIPPGLHPTPLPIKIPLPQNPYGPASKAPPPKNPLFPNYDRTCTSVTKYVKLPKGKTIADLLISPNLHQHLARLQKLQRIKQSGIQDFFQLTICRIAAPQPNDLWRRTKTIR